MTAISLQHRRAELEARIEELIALLDLIDGDENLEPYLADTYPADEDREGGDVQDERHDLEDEGDSEPFLGWGNPRCGTPDVAEGWVACDPHDAIGFGETAMAFNGDGHHIGRKLLRDHVKDKRKLARALEATRVSSAYGRLI
ncbi:hypothetical protein [Rhizobium sp. NXC24]|uniref:hypothetical protein n=1 Tax=Rhizobium sp. NXC24 TaxID=2048897 RepID=UPI000CDF457E|nr:hypothetical protein [Rhizobium sp. NXC24]AVA21587.1 hypothetical protein NXC24_CH01948 [Rhizobium sp. NXC24]